MPEIGEGFGYLIVMERAGKNKHGHTLWKSRCVCGKFTINTAGNLRRPSASCGCISRPKVTAATIASNIRRTKHGYAQNKFGKTKTEYRIHGGMLSRCYNTNHVGYKNYGHRGILVCDRWRYGEDGKSGFECFLHDMGNRPDILLTLDRTNNNGNYEPSNCRWATKKEQAANSRRNKKDV